MAKQVLKILLVFIQALFFIRCAQVVPLTGGKRDLIPPKLLRAIPGEKSIQFNSQLIVLEFDEYIKIKDLANQLTVSPKLKTAPEVEASGKSVKISLKREDLAPNTTYRLSFGKAIVDMNEGNAIPNYEYVFSTGDYIDSLKIEGKVMDAFSNKAAANVLVALYTGHEPNDSLPYIEAPDYISKSNDNGDFKFSNLPYKTFKAYAFEDKNKNTTYDGETEKIAFLDSDLELRSDTSLVFRLFQEEASKSFIKKTLLPYPGLVQIILNKKQRVHVSALSRRDSTGLYETKAGQEKDTLSVFYKNINDTLSLVVSFLNKEDTLKISLPNKAANKKKFRNYMFNVSGGILGINTPLILTFSNWMNIQEAEVADIRLSSPEDSTVNDEAVKGHWLDINRFEITNRLREGVNYRIKVDSCVFLDINDICNDSSSTNFKTESKVEFGKVTLKMVFNKKLPYTIQLIKDKEEVAKEAFVSFSLSSSNAVSIDFIDVKPGTYLVKVIFDDNGNRKWDTGNLLLKKQPERVLINSKQIKVLSDWEIEEEIPVKE